MEIGFYSPFPSSPFSVFPLHFTSKHQRLLHNKWTVNHWTNLLAFIKLAVKRLLLFKRTVDNSKLNFSLHLIIIFHQWWQNNSMSCIIQLKNKSNQWKSILCPLTQSKLKEVFSLLAEYHTDTVLVFLTHFPFSPPIRFLLSGFYIILSSSH